mmetsp:Transcript_20704/g.44933  ORF Transcript_20704/g.44933 Transcript_20704/m.44933 type:complete len:113 (-) Transcript_20704:44-382(-)
MSSHHTDTLHNAYIHSRCQDCPLADYLVPSGVVHISSSSINLPTLHFWVSNQLNVAACLVLFQQWGYNQHTTTIFKIFNLWTARYDDVAPLLPAELPTPTSRDVTVDSSTSC